MATSLGILGIRDLNAVVRNRDKLNAILSEKLRHFGENRIIFLSDIEHGLGTDIWKP